jgi:hypothetical protein
VHTKSVEGAVVEAAKMNGKNGNDRKVKNNKNKTKPGAHTALSVKNI